MHNRHLLNHHLSQLTPQQNSHFLHWHYSQFDDHNFQIHGQTLFYLFILFSIILLVTLLLLYARWYFRFRHIHHPHYPHSSHQTPHNHPQACADTCQGLDPLAIKAMPIILHQQSSVGREDEMECCICLGAFEDGDKVKVLPKCDHRFHSECVDRWLSTQSSCPLCRLSFTVIKPMPSDSVSLPV
ncbi:RING-H2 finger protein ATL66 [Bienertia sinuspersici]